MERKHIKVRKNTVAMAAGLGLVLAACTSTAQTQEGHSGAAAHAHGGAQGMHSEQCMAMHEQMMSHMSGSGENGAHQTMSPEMMAQHQKCMEGMPEMRAQMMEHCGQMHAQSGSHAGGGMHQHCMMMQNAGDAEGHENHEHGDTP